MGLEYGEINFLFTQWLDSLAQQQRASTVKEQLVENPDHAQLIAKEFIRHGITITHPVESALAKMKVEQVKEDTVELAILMSELPVQWQTYRIYVQQNARPYFQAHQHEASDFMMEYFKRVTFADIWNDVWTEYVGAPGHRDLSLLDQVRTYLTRLSKPTAAQRALEAKALIRANKPELHFPFTQQDLSHIARLMKTEADGRAELYTNRIKTLTERLSTLNQGEADLKKVCESTLQLVMSLKDTKREWMSTQIEETVPPAQIFETILNILRAAKTTCTRLGVMNAIKQFNERLHVIHNENDAALMALVPPPNANEATLESSPFAVSYQDYLRANVDYVQVKSMFDWIYTTEEALAPLSQEQRGPIKEQLDAFKGSISREYIDKLYETKEQKEKAYLVKQTIAIKAALSVDSSRNASLNIDVGLTAAARLDTDTEQLEHMNRLLDNIVFNSRQTIESRLRTSPAEFCAGSEYLRLSKRNIRNQLNRVRASSKPFYSVDAIEQAKTKVEQISLDLDALRARRQAARQRERDNWLFAAWDRPPNSHKSELMQRPLLNLFTDSLRGKLGEPRVADSLAASMLSLFGLEDAQNRAIDSVDKQLWDVMLAPEAPVLTFWAVYGAQLFALWVVYKDQVRLLKLTGSAEQ
jgi:hypothetical protein